MKKEFTAKNWEKYVRLARQYYSRYEVNRFKIAGYAIEACDLSKGGRKDDRFTVRTFARAVGVNEHTLYEWVRVKRYVIDKLPVKTDIDSIPYQKIIAVMSRVGKDTPPKMVNIFMREEMNVDPKIYKWKDYSKSLRAIVHNAKNPVLLMEIPTQTIIEVIEKSNLIKELLTRELNFRKIGESGAAVKFKEAISRKNKAIRSANTLSKDEAVA